MPRSASWPSRASRLIPLRCLRAAPFILAARGLTKHFAVGRGLLGRGGGVVRAVDDIGFTIEPGRTLGVVGESGCGKTTTAKLVLRLEKPTAGQILFENEDVARLEGDDLRRYRKSVQAVFQDPYASLNPRMRVDAIIAEPLITHERLDAPAVAGPLSPRVFGRPTPAHRHRPRTGALAAPGRP